jgi:hypothetical protein
VLSIKTNVALIVSSACGYYFLAGVQTFGVEFVTKQYGIAQVVARSSCSSSAPQASWGCSPAAHSAMPSSTAAISTGEFS